MPNLKLFELPSVKFWLKKAAHSPRTVKSYLYCFDVFVGSIGLDPEAVISEWQKVRYDYAERERFLDKHSELIERFYYDRLQGTPKAKSTYLASILSFYKHNKIPVEVDIQERIYLVNHNRAIKREEIARILDHATLRDRCFFLMMVESGLRPQTLVMLRYGNIKEDFEANRVPMMIKLESEILKDNVSSRFSFLGENAFKALKEYLAPRLHMKDEDVIFTAVHTQQQKEACLSPNLFSTQFAQIVKKLGLSEKKEGRFRRELNLYTLRKYFRNNIKVSDSAYREFWMGHSLGVDRNYFNAWFDDPKVVEDHRAEYGKAYAGLRIYERDTTQTEIMELLRKKDTQIKQLSDQLSEKEQEIQTLNKKVEDLQSNLDPTLFGKSWNDLRKETVELVLKVIKDGKLTEKERQSVEGQEAKKKVEA